MILRELQEIHRSYCALNTDRFDKFKEVWQRYSISSHKRSAIQSKDAPKISDILNAMALSWAHPEKPRSTNCSVLYSLYCVYFSRLEPDSKYVKIKVLPVESSDESDECIRYIWTRMLSKSTSAFLLVPFIDWHIIPEEFCDVSKREVLQRVHKVVKVCRQYAHDCKRQIGSNTIDHLAKLCEGYECSKSMLVDIAENTISEMEKSALLSSSSFQGLEMSKTLKNIYSRPNPSQTTPSSSGKSRNTTRYRRSLPYWRLQPGS